VTQHATGRTAFYDIDTPVTLAKLESGDFEYLSPELIALYDLYLSFTGGPVLARLEEEYGSPRARALYCSVDPALYFPEAAPQQWDLGYLGTYSDDRQPTVEQLLIAPEQLPQSRFVVARAAVSAGDPLAGECAALEHSPPGEHRAFLQCAALHAERHARRYDPRRLHQRAPFRSGACGTPIISDAWEGLETLFEPGRRSSSSAPPLK
jgi:spore maturation protein CgeB